VIAAAIAGTLGIVVLLALVHHQDATTGTEEGRENSGR
jgi:hypothetical protein